MSCFRARSVRLVCLHVCILVAGVHMSGSDAPKFTSKSQTLRVVAGDSVLLPCAVDELGPYVLLWRRGSLILTADKLKVSRDPRISLKDGYNLKIVNVTSRDAGEYVCQIADEVARDQIHNVQVLLPPTIQSSVPNSQLTTRRGGTVTLTCTASGNPMPTILWTKKDSPSLYKEGFSITLEKVERHHAGVYQCSASNGVGAPVSVDLRLDVLHAPEVVAERVQVFTAEGATAQLTCVVLGMPPPKVTWFQNGSQVELGGRFREGSSRDRYWLTINNVETGDFGNYSCLAENSLGKATATLLLQGKPGRCVRLSSPYSHTTNSYNLTWAVDSYAPLEEAKLIYRRIMINDSLHEMGQWVQESWILEGGNLTVPLSPPSHRLWHDIRDLEQSSVFQAQLQVRNRYGWGDLSDVYQFYTRAPDEDVVEHNMELLSSKGAASLVSLWFLHTLLLLLLL